MKAEFRFIRDNAFLIAYVDDQSGAQQLIMEHRDGSGKVLVRNIIDYIHTAVMDILAKDFNEDVRCAVQYNPKAKEFYPELHAGLFHPELGYDRE